MILRDAELLDKSRLELLTVIQLSKKSQAMEGATIATDVKNINNNDIGFALLVVIQFPSGVVPLAEMAGFTPCMGICWSEIFLQGACPCLPPTSVF